MPRLAVSLDFTQQLAALARPVRRDAVVSVRRFLHNSPAGPVPERVRNARDPRVTTLRLADRHRAVAVRQRDVYWLVTILPDAEAYTYAQRHRFTVNSAIGVIEVWDAEALSRVEPALRRSAAGSSKRLYGHICETDLIDIGIDQELLLPMVRMMATDAHLAAVEPLLPESQYAPLAVLARGGSLAEAWRELDGCRVTSAENIDLDDLEAALHRSPGQAAFAADRVELDRVLTKPHWCTFLYAPQHTYANWPVYDRPVLVTGGAGTGKTVISLHRAAYLAKENSGPILLTTFSQVLANELSAKLDLIIDDEVVRKRVEVTNVDRLAHRIVAAHEGKAPTLVGDVTKLWEEAAGSRFGAAFLLREWEQVILSQNLRTLEEYLAAERPGRGVQLNADIRTSVWRAVEHVEGRLRESGRRTLLQLASEGAELLGRTTDVLESDAPRREPYKHVVIDEAQDLHPAQWRLLRAAVPPGPNDMFIVGDPHQRMFDTRAALAGMGIPVRRFHLKISYRLPHEILSFGVRLRGGGPVDGLVEGAAEMYGYRSTVHGPRPLVREYVSQDAEIGGLVAHVSDWLADGVAPEEIAVTARTVEIVRIARAALRDAGIEVKVTMLHGMKGLEFRRVAVIGVAEGIIPAPDALTPHAEDPMARAHDLQRERGLLYVACTRANELLYVSYSGRASPFLPA